MKAPLQRERPLPASANKKARQPICWASSLASIKEEKNRNSPKNEKQYKNEEKKELAIKTQKIVMPTFILQKEGKKFHNPWQKLQKYRTQKSVQQK